MSIYLYTADRNAVWPLLKNVIKCTCNLSTIRFLSPPSISKILRSYFHAIKSQSHCRKHRHLKNRITELKRSRNALLKKMQNEKKKLHVPAPEKSPITLISTPRRKKSRNIGRKHVKKIHRSTNAGVLFLEIHLKSHNEPHIKADARFRRRFYKSIKNRRFFLTKKCLYIYLNLIKYRSNFAP